LKGKISLEFVEFGLVEFGFVWGGGWPLACGDEHIASAIRFPGDKGSEYTLSWMINVAKAEINVNFSPWGGVDNGPAGYGDQDTPKAQEAKGFSD
jgi:hypothetical protein